MAGSEMSQPRGQGLNDLRKSGSKAFPTGSPPVRLGVGAAVGRGFQPDTYIGREQWAASGGLSPSPGRGDWPGNRVNDCIIGLF